jgi:hypothetical protein
MSEHDSISELVSAMLVFIERHGSLDGFDLAADEKERVLQAAMNQGLIVWNENRRRYELTRSGHKWLINYSVKKKEAELCMSYSGFLSRIRR